MRPASPRTALAVLIAAVAAVKIFLQVTIPGFLQGDDVETLESAFRAALGIEYAAWEIRSHLLPEILIAPLLRAAASVPGIGTDGLLLVASIPFIAAGALATFLVFFLARAWGLPDRDAVVASVLYAVHAIAVVYGIGGFPRPLVAPLIVGAALLATRGNAYATLLAGLLVGLAGAARYSEWMFVLPLMAIVLVPRMGSVGTGCAGPFPVGREAGNGPPQAVPTRTRRTLAALAGFLLGVCIVGFYDVVSGDGAFSSLVEFARYTLAEGSSSMQASQPAWWYLGRLHQWMPLTAVPLLVWGWRSGRRAAVLWIAIPLVVLSFVHHKELRYLQNVIPFLAIAIAAGVPRSAAVPAARAPLLLLAMTVLWAAWGVNRLEKRSSSAVAAARAMAAESPAAVALGQAWAYGNHIYVRPANVIDLPVPAAADDLVRAREAEFVAVYASTMTAELRERLADLEFVPWREFQEGGRSVAVWRGDEKRMQNAEFRMQN